MLSVTENTAIECRFVQHIIYNDIFTDYYYYYRNRTRRNIYYRGPFNNYVTLF